MVCLRGCSILWFVVVKVDTCLKTLILLPKLYKTVKISTLFCITYRGHEPNI